jgi:hypothetical protein
MSANASFKQLRNPGITKIVWMTNPGHALAIDNGWQGA